MGRRQERDGWLDMVDKTAELAEYLNGEWPQCFNDGFQDAVAGAVLETSLSVRAPSVILR